MPPKAKTRKMAKSAAMGAARRIGKRCKIRPLKKLSGSGVKKLFKGAKKAAKSKAGRAIANEALNQAKKRASPENRKRIQLAEAAASGDASMAVDMALDMLTKK